jgi:diacylglycerol kinase family enzyme
VQISAGVLEDPRIKHYRVRRVVIQSDPPVPVMADGVTMGEGTLIAEVHPAALVVMSGLPPVNEEAEAGAP